MTTTDFRPGQRTVDDHACHAESEPFPVSQAELVTHTLHADGDQFAGSHSRGEARNGRAACNQLLDGQQPGAAHGNHAVEGILPPAAGVGALTNSGARLADINLALLAESLDDLERTRIAAENRHRSLCQVYGLEGTPEEQAAAGLVEALAGLEHQTILRLNRAMRANPLGGWVKTQRGVGEKQAARLLAAIGDPYWNTLHDRPRTVSELWAYCGLHVLPVGQSCPDHHSRSAGGDQFGNPDQNRSEDQEGGVGVAAKRRKGQKANWSATAKMRAYLIATSCIKQPDGNRYRDIYVARRAHTAVTHPDWTAGHSHNDGLRIVSKVVLKDLWIAARDLHESAVELEDAA